MEPNRKVHSKQSPGMPNGRRRDTLEKWELPHDRTQNEGKPHSTDGGRLPTHLTSLEAICRRRRTT